LIENNETEHPEETAQEGDLDGVAKKTSVETEKPHNQE